MARPYPDRVWPRETISSLACLACNSDVSRLERRKLVTSWFSNEPQVTHSELSSSIHVSGFLPLSPHQGSAMRFTFMYKELLIAFLIQLGTLKQHSSSYLLTQFLLFMLQGSVDQLHVEYDNLCRSLLYPLVVMLLISSESWVLDHTLNYTKKQESSFR